MKFTIKVEEILRRDIEVEAETADEALDKVCTMYTEEEIVLDYNDFTDVTIELVWMQFLMGCLIHPISQKTQ